MQGPSPAQPPRQNRPHRQNLPRQTRLCAGPSMRLPPTWHAWHLQCRPWPSRGWGPDLGTASLRGAKGQAISGTLDLSELKINASGVCLSAAKGGVRRWLRS